MSSVRDLSVMDWNAKTPSHWDYESLVLFNVDEMPKLTQPSERGIGSGSMYSSGGGCSGSDLGNSCSSSKSSVSASIESVPRAGPRESMICFSAVNEDQDKKGLGRAGNIGNSPELPVSMGSAEPLLGLKLGKRTYFEDACTANNMKILSFPTVPLAPSASTKKSRVSPQRLQNIHCQVEGCNVDLTTAKSYHRKHRVCENHSKCPMVIVAGQERRFCQQCSRFHALSEFDQKKRSCRRRLYDHNARRRKPLPNAISFSSSRLSSSLYDGRQQMDLLFDRSPFGHMRPEKPTWENSCSFDIMKGKGSCTRSMKGGSFGGSFNLPSNELSMSTTSLHNDLDRLLPFRDTTADVLNQGLEASVIASNLDGAPDLRRALSLLSTDSWGSAHPGSTCTNDHLNLAQTAMQMAQSNLGYWQAEQPIAQETRVRPFPLHSEGSQFQESFVCLKHPVEQLPSTPCR